MPLAFVTEETVLLHETLEILATVDVSIGKLAFQSAGDDASSVH